MKKTTYIPFAIIAVLSALWLGCTDKDEPTIVETHISGWMETNNSSFHANKIAEVGNSSCARCHGDDYKGGTSEVSCFTCHTQGPSGHPEGWFNSSSDDFHGKVVFDEGEESCYRCHGEDLAGGTSGQSCYECHPNGFTGKHPDGWLDPSSEPWHGTPVIAGGAESCSACHGEDYMGGWTGVSCFTCHNGPSGHPENFISPSSETSHVLVVAEKGNESCAACHGADYQGGWAEISCYTCHDGGPSGHPATSEWLSPSSDDFHGKALFELGEENCMTCHGADYTGGTSGQSCYECHDEGFTAGHPEGWLNPSSDNWHGTPVIDSGAESCAACHGEDYMGGWTEVSCYTCHNGPSGHPQGFTDPTSSTGHAAVIAAEGNESCAACHGADYMGGWAEVSCFTCHAGGPSGHPAQAEWLSSSSDSFHGKAVFEDGSESCIRCHGDDLKGGTSGQSCYQCHQESDIITSHPDGWINPTADPWHGGTVVELTASACTSCHGEDYKGGWSGNSCYTCHNGPSGHPQGFIDPSSTTGHVAIVQADGNGSCAACHGEDYKGGWAEVSCYTCHAGGPSGHPAPNVWLNDENSLSHNNQFIQDPNECWKCHVAWDDGGVTGVACTKCHN